MYLRSLAGKGIVYDVVSLLRRNEELLTDVSRYHNA